jgi:hypothetical protein
MVYKGTKIKIKWCSASANQSKRIFTKKNTKHMHTDQQHNNI